MSCKPTTHYKNAFQITNGAASEFEMYFAKRLPAPKVLGPNGPNQTQSRINIQYYRSLTHIWFMIAFPAPAAPVTCVCMPYYVYGVACMDLVSLAC